MKKIKAMTAFLAVLAAVFLMVPVNAMAETKASDKTAATGKTNHKPSVKKKHHKGTEKPAQAAATAAPAAPAAAAQTPAATNPS